MKKRFITALLLLSFLFSMAQDKEEVSRLVSEGIALHDKGDFEGAIKKYDEALKIDKENFNALYEKSYSLVSMGKKKECANICKDLLKKFPDHPNLAAVYIQYGSVLDDMDKPKDALEVFDEGIKKYPDQYLLYFNKGLTLQKSGRIEEALLEYQHSLAIRPLHSSSNYYTGMLLQKPNKIPALLAYCTFMAIEPNSKRSQDGYTQVNQIIGANVKKEGNNITIMLDPSMLDDKKNKKAENNFRSVEMIFSLTSALDNSKGIDSIAKSPVQKFSLKLQLLINSLGESLKDNKGFYWEHYVPFFVEMKEKGWVDVVARLIYLSDGTEESADWVKDNEDKIGEFYDWLKAYKWNK